MFELRGLSVGLLRHQRVQKGRPPISFQAAVFSYKYKRVLMNETTESLC